MDSKNKTRRAIIPKRTLIYIFIFIYTLSTESLATLFQFYFETFSFSKKIYNFYKKRTNSFTEVFLLLENFDRSNISSREHFIRFIEIRYIEIRFIEIFDSYDVYLNCMTYISDCERFESYSSRFFCHLHISKELKLSALGATVPIYIALWECI